MILWLGSAVMLLLQTNTGMPMCGPNAPVGNGLCQPGHLPDPGPVTNALPLFKVEVLLEDGGKPDSRPDIQIPPCGLGPSSGGESGDGLCVAVITLKGFREVRKPLNSRGKNVVILSRLGAEGDVFPANSVSVSQLSVPAAAHRAYAKGEAAAGLERWPEAEKLFRQAVELAPPMALAWDELGWSLERQGKPGEAREAYRSAIAADPTLVRPLVHLAGLAILERNWNEAAGLTAKALSLQPSNFPRAFLYDALAQVNLGRLGSAEMSVRQAIATDPAHTLPLAEYLLGEILLAKNDPEARPHFQAYLQHEPGGPYAEPARQSLEKLESKRP